MFHLVSPSLQISVVDLLGPVPGLCVGVGLLVCFVVVFFCLSRGNLSQSQLIPVVDRPCLVLVRQCRKKKKCFGGVFVVVFLWWCFCGGVVVFLWWKCDGVFVVVFLWSSCGGVFVVFFLRWRFCGGVLVVVFLWCCFCGGVV